MNTSKRQSGFTAVELLVTLFVAAAFLIAAYQLFNLVVKDGGATRSESRAANVAYDYLRQYAASATTIPCTASSPLNNAPLSIDGLTSVTVNVTVSCLPDAISSLSKVEVAVTYNNPAQTIKYATYTSSAGASTIADVTNGLVAWWKLNGDANNSVGSPNGVISNASSTTGQNGSADNAYAFNGSNTSINTASNFGLGAQNVTLSCWIYNPSASNHGMFIHAGWLAGYGVGIGGTTTDTNGSKLIMIYEGVRWIPTTTNISTGWHHIVMLIDGSGVPTGYVDGVSTGAYPGGNSGAPNSTITTIGAITGTNLDTFNGSIDDVRLYNRALPLSDILTLYSNGAQ
jgi:prepilin-type N-terminal cleavage/methylation domain-containing protein